MTDFGRWVVWGFLPSFIAGILINQVVPLESVDSTIFGTFLRDPILRTIGISLILVIPVYYGVSYLISIGKQLLERRQEIQSSNSPSMMVSNSKPSTLLWNGIVRHYGVDWYVIFGESRRGNEPYAYITRGPCCPNCQTEMLRRNQTKFIVLKQRIWLCPECETTIERPDDMLFEERKGVENIVDKHILAAINHDDPDAFLRENDKIETAEWGRRIN